MQSVETITNNIKQVYNQHLSEEVILAKQWYPKAHDNASFMAQMYSKKLLNTSGVISALSPLKEWSHNLEITHLYFNGFYKHTGRQIDKCHKIVKSTDKNEIKSILGGLKTSNFFEAIFNPSNNESMVIDRHIIDVCLYPNGSLYGKNKLTSKQYNLLKTVLLQEAKNNNYQPNDFQALLWITQKRIKKL